MIIAFSFIFVRLCVLPDAERGVFSCFCYTNLRILGQTHPTHKTLKEEISHFFRIQTVALPSRVDNKAPCKFAGFQNNFLHLR